MTSKIIGRCATCWSKNSCGAQPYPGRRFAFDEGHGWFTTDCDEYECQVHPGPSKAPVIHLACGCTHIPADGVKCQVPNCNHNAEMSLFVATGEKFFCMVHGHDAGKHLQPSLVE